MSAGLLVAWIAFFGGAAPVPLPTIEGRGAVAIQSQWSALKAISDPDEQRRAVLAGKGRILRLRCTDLVDLVSLVGRPDLGLRLRDTVRWRTLARPEMAVVIVEGLRRLHARRPNAQITLGDVAQPGCGQIRWGTIVRFDAGPDVAAELAVAPLRFGERGTWRAVDPDAFMDEWPRFHEGLGPVWVETRFTGRTRQGDVRIEARRFSPGEVLTEASLGRLLERTQKRLRDRRHVRWDRVSHTLPSGRTVKLRRATWTDPRRHRFMEAIFRRGRSRRARAPRLLRVREARSDIKKPTSFKVEERYRFEWDGEAGARVRRYRLHYEAHHTSHIAGFDADLSYVTLGNADHFDAAEAVIDPEGSWLWLRSLYEAGEALHVPIKAFFVDPKVRRILASVPGAKRHPAWRKVRRSPGHDSHVHLRVGPSARWAGRSWPELLARLGLR